MTPLCELALKFGTDKCQKHNYTPVYYSLFKDRADRVRRMMEIGIKKGASLFMWQEFFPNAQIFGVDRKPHLLINAGRIKSFLCDQGYKTTLVDAAKAVGGPLDLIVDDGSHQPEHQVISAHSLLPFLAVDGIYVIEDVNDDIILSQMPKGFSHKRVRTSGTHSDSVLVILRRN